MESKLTSECGGRSKSKGYRAITDRILLVRLNSLPFGVSIHAYAPQQEVCILK